MDKALLTVGEAAARLSIGRQELPPTGTGTWELYANEIIIGQFVAQFAYFGSDHRYQSTAQRLGLVVPIWPVPGVPVEWPPPVPITVESANALNQWSRVTP